MKTSDFEYELPGELIADRPPEERGQSRMMVVDRAKGSIDHLNFVDLPEYLNDGDLLVLNDTRIAPGFEEAFEEMWRTRKSYLDEVPGFKEFHFLRGPKDDECTLYVSHSVWASHETFEAWTNSDSFKQAHAKAKSPEGMHLGHPNFEGFEVVL